VRRNLVSRQWTWALTPIDREPPWLCILLGSPCSHYHADWQMVKQCLPPTHPSTGARVQLWSSGMHDCVKGFLHYPRLHSSRRSPGPQQLPQLCCTFQHWPQCSALGDSPKDEPSSLALSHISVASRFGPLGPSIFGVLG